MWRLRGLLLNVGGTLVPNAFAVSDRTYARLKLERLRGEFGAVLPWFQPLVGHRFSSDAIEPDTLRQDVESEVVRFLGKLGVAVTRGEVARICRACAVPLTQLVTLASGAEAAVRDARGLGLRLGICSNTFWRDDALVQEDWRAFGLADSIGAYVTSRSTGYAKPHPAIFERALAKIAVQLAEAAVLGDRLDVDIAGGAAVGMRTIWLRSADPSLQPDPTPNPVIESLTELQPVLQAWTAPGLGPKVGLRRDSGDRGPPRLGRVSR